MTWMKKKDMAIVIAVVVMLVFLGVQPFLATYYVSEPVIETPSDYYYVEPSYTGEPEPSPPSGGGGWSPTAGNASIIDADDWILSPVTDIVFAMMVLGGVLAMFYAVANVIRRAIE